jgi:hypothetical protein
MIKIEVLRTVFGNNSQSNYAQHIQYMYANYTNRNKPGLVFLMTRIRDDKNGEQRKQRDGIAIGAYPNAIGSVDANHLEVMILQNLEG